MVMEAWHAMLASCILKLVTTLQGYMSIDEGFNAVTKHVHQTTGREAVGRAPRFASCSLIRTSAR